MRALDIAIAGCGPGGLAAALFLHRDGHRVTLFDRFPEPRPIGSGLILQPTGLAVLDMLGLGAAARSRGAAITRLFGRAVPSQQVVLDVRYAALAGDQSGVGIHRGTLFHLLFDEVVRQGIDVDSDREVRASTLVNGGRILSLSNGRDVGPFDLVVDAMGTQSPLVRERVQPVGALWTTLDWVDGFNLTALEQRYLRASKMAGVLPIGRLPCNDAMKAAFFWSLRGDELADWRRRGLAAWNEDVLALWPETEPLLAQIHDADELTFARYCHRTSSHAVEAALAHLGDAWHSTSPQLGQGANMALLDAAAFSAALAQSHHVGPALALYLRMRRPHVRAYQAMSYIFTPFYQSRSRLLPLVRDYLAGPLSRIPPAPRLLASLVAGTVGAPLRRLAPAPGDRLPSGAPAPKAERA